MDAHPPWDGEPAGAVGSSPFTRPLTSQDEPPRSGPLEGCRVRGEVDAVPSPPGTFQTDSQEGDRQSCAPETHERCVQGTWHRALCRWAASTWSQCQRTETRRLPGSGPHAHRVQPADNGLRASRAPPSPGSPVGGRELFLPRGLVSAPALGFVTPHAHTSGSDRLRVQAPHTSLPFLHRAHPLGQLRWSQEEDGEGTGLGPPWEPGLTAEPGQACRPQARITDCRLSLISGCSSTAY